MEVIDLLLGSTCRLFWSIAPRKIHVGGPGNRQTFSFKCEVLRRFVCCSKEKVENTAMSRKLRDFDAIFVPCVFTKLLITARKYLAACRLPSFLFFSNAFNVLLQLVDLIFHPLLCFCLKLGDLRLIVGLFRAQDSVGTRQACAGNKREWRRQRKKEKGKRHCAKRGLKSENIDMILTTDCTLRFFAQLLKPHQKKLLGTVKLHDPLTFHDLF